MITKARLSVVGIATTLFLSSAASADPDPPPAPPAPPAPAADADVCSAAYEGAQELMRPNRTESKLLVARDSLRTCLRSNCKSWMVSDCSKWLSDVETRIPGVVFSAKDTAGRDLTDVKVTRSSGETVAERLDGHSIEMEPGAHDFVFLGTDGTRLEKHAIVREGEKAQNIGVVFEGPPATPPGGGKPIEGATTHKTSTLRYVGYGLAGAGAVGIGIGAIFGLMAISKKSDADCDSENRCEPTARAAAFDRAGVATVAFVVGGVLGAGGIALIVLSPSGSKARVDARITPGGVAIGGAW